MCCLHVGASTAGGQRDIGGDGEAFTEEGAAGEEASPIVLSGDGSHGRARGGRVKLRCSRAAAVSDSGAQRVSAKGNAGAQQERRRLHEGGSEMGRWQNPGCYRTMGGGGSA
jgi:hypothetical protein